MVKSTAWLNFLELEVYEKKSSKAYFGQENSLVPVANPLQEGKNEIQFLKLI